MTLELAHSINQFTLQKFRTSNFMALSRFVIGVLNVVFWVLFVKNYWEVNNNFHGP